MVALFAPAGRAEAQVGLVSRDSRVALVAHVRSSASIQAVSSPRVLGGSGSVREAKVTVRLASNSGYRLVVHATQSSGRIWVLGLDGNYQELQENSPVAVAHLRHAGESERDIVYRLESSSPAGGTVTLPVRYEIMVNPVL